MNVVISVLLGTLSLILLIYAGAFVNEAILLKKNPRPRMSNGGARFEKVNKIKTQKMYNIEAR